MASHAIRSCQALSWQQTPKEQRLLDSRVRVYNNEWAFPYGRPTHMVHSYTEGNDLALRSKFINYRLETNHHLFIDYSLSYLQQNYCQNI